MIIRDSIHKDIVINEQIIEDLIRTREFQRLRRIKQLGLSNLIYPSAEHNRYTHSIGVYHLGRTFSKILEDKMGIKFDAKEKKCFHIACLLHDLGHGPFSHAAENFFNYDHEEYTLRILKCPETEINKILVANDCLDGVALFVGKKHSNKILGSLLSSSVDVDRMDYLNRDAYNCGVSYGQFDLERMKKIIDVDDAQQRIVFDEHSIHTVEDFLISRYHMFTQVYLNDKSIGYEALIGEILRHIHTLYNQGYQFQTSVINTLEKFFKDEIAVSDFLDMDDYKMFSLFKELYNGEKDEKLRTLINVLLSFGELKMSTNKADCKECVYSWKSEAYAKSIYHNKKPIYIKMDNGEVKNLQDVSKLVNLIADKLAIEQETLYFGIKK